MKVVSSESIILRQRDFKERDRMVTFLARDRGKLSGIARGAKVITGRTVGACEPFTHCTVFFVEKAAGGLVQIRKVDPLPPHLFLVSDYDRFLLFTYFTEWVEQSSISAGDSEAFFTLLSRGLRRAARLPREALPDLRLEFELDLLGVLGLQPEWKRCVTCGAPIFGRTRQGIRPRRAERHRFDVQEGGVRCPDCPGSGRAFDLAPATLSQFAAWRAAAVERQADEAGAQEAQPGAPALAPLLGQDSAGPDGHEPGLDGPARAELDRALRAHLRHHLERQPKSLPLVDEFEHGLDAREPASRI